MTEEQSSVKFIASSSSMAEEPNLSGVSLYVTGLCCPSLLSCSHMASHSVFHSEIKQHDPPFCPNGCEDLVL